MPVLMRKMNTERETPTVRVSSGMFYVSDRSENPQPLGCADFIENL